MTDYWLIAVASLVAGVSLMKLSGGAHDRPGLFMTGCMLLAGGLVLAAVLVA